METLSATETSFLLVACQQAVLAGAWLASLRLLAGLRRAVLLWAASAAFGGAALVMFVVSVQPGAGLLRPLGNIVIVGAMVAMQCGVRSFFATPVPWRWHVGALVLAGAVVALTMRPEHAPVRVAVITGLLCALCLATAFDLQRLTRERMALRHGVLFSVPLLLAALAFAARGLRALLAPEVIAAEAARNSLLNVGSAYVQGMVSLMQQLALIALVVARLVGELQRASRHDALTGLLNRRAMEEVLNAETRRAQRLREPFCVLMVDVDRFKAINDVDGHAAGDRALQHLATLLAAQMREIDRVGRWGGEEFVVLMPGTTLNAAVALAERLRARAEAVPLHWQDHTVPVTLSIGVGQWEAGDTSPAVLLARADAALYRAKAGGRNRVEVQRPLAEIVPVGGFAA